MRKVRSVAPLHPNCSLPGVLGLASSSSTEQVVCASSLSRRRTTATTLGNSTLGPICGTPVHLARDSELTGAIQFSGKIVFESVASQTKSRASVPAFVCPLREKTST